MKTPKHTHSLRYRIIFWLSILVGVLIVGLLINHLDAMREACDGSSFENFMYWIISLLIFALIIAGLAVRKIIHNQIIFTHELQLRNRKMRELATRDGLTGAYNHRYFERKLSDEWERFLRFKHALSCIMVDIDNFKSVNDTFGHRGGDVVIRGVAKILLENLREVDIISRYGGEEFTIIFLEKPNTREGLKKIMEKLRKQIENKEFEFDGEKIKVSASLGGALVPNPKIDSPEKLIHLADKMMYKVKQNGKNGSAVFGED